MYAHDRFCPTNSRSPEPVGICRRCGFKYFLRDLVDQYEWAGPSLSKILTRVCTRTCLDLPNETLRTITIGPDPVVIFDPSPPFYAQQNAAPTPIMGGFAPLTDDGGIVELTDDAGNILVGG